MKGLRGKSFFSVIVGAVAAALLWARAPFAPRNFWAEDGKLLFAQAQEGGWVESITSSAGGYFLFLPRVLGTVSTLGPLENAPATMFAMCVLVSSWFAATIFLTGDRYLDRLWSRVALALVPLLLPIVGFEVIGGLANLHFVILCPAAAVLVGCQEGKGRRANDVLLATMAGLTSPLTLSLAPLAFLRMWWDRRTYGTKLPAPVVVGWAVGITVHLAMIFTMANNREFSSDRSISKAGFLFLERVVSYNLLPFWPRISNADATGGIDGELVIRALVGLVVLVLLATTVVVGAVHHRRRGSKELAELILVLPIAGAAMFLVASMLTGSEPRYAVLPAFCIVWTLLIVSESLRESERIQPVGRVVAAVIGACLLASVVTHWVPSPLRRTGPTWVSGLDAAVGKCATNPDGRVEVPILPEGWTILLDCSDVVDG